MSEIQGGGPISPRERKLYEQEYKHGADLFQRALVQYEKSDNPYQKEQFGEVMDKAMRVLNETARQLKRKDLLRQNDEISKEYEDYKKNPSDLLASKLADDIAQAKQSIEKSS